MSLNFRKGRPGPEQEMVDKFLSDYKSVFQCEGLQVTPLVEAYAEVGIPDVILVIWDPEGGKNWNPARQNLNKNDIKILHYVSSFGKRGVLQQNIPSQLSFDYPVLEKSLTRLWEADLINFECDRISLKDFDRSFFIKQIISVEAKINNWRSALFQAELNQNFCSHSYVLLPENKVTDDVIAACGKKMGLLAYNGDKTIIKKKARKNKIPGSYFSWVLNEYLGCQCTTTQMSKNVN
jgi:hypothetical protein